MRNEKSRKTFVSLFSQSGWKQAEAARRLCITSNHVNMILRGKAYPSKSLVELLRLKLEELPDAHVQKSIQHPPSLAIEQHDNYRSRSREPSPEPVKLIGQTLRYLGLTQAELGQLLGVHQATLSRLQNGDSRPSEALMKRLMDLHRNAARYARMKGISPPAFTYLCSFAENYDDDRSVQATKALQDTLNALRPPWENRNVDDAELELIVRSASLPKGTRAHCFADNVDQPSSFLILVSNKLSKAEQRSVAVEEVYAHVVKKYLAREEPHRSVPSLITIKRDDQNKG